MEQDISKHSLSTSSFNEKKCFVIKLFVCLFVFALYINSLLPQYSQRYNASLIDKVKRLESITTPKIVLIGNSNLAFGIDSKLIESEMGMPVVNMGLHGGLGNAFHEEMAKLNVTPGDIYIICHNDYNDNNRIENSELAWITIENNFHLWRLLRFSDINEMIKSLPVYLRKSFTLVSSGTGNKIPDSIYARNAFNEYGDIGRLRKGEFYQKGNVGKIPKIGNGTIERINKLNRDLVSKDAILLIAGYPIRNGTLADSAQKFISFQEGLSARLDCPVISNYIDYMFDYRYFYDANAHLNSEGTYLRTVQLISDLKRWMNPSSGIDTYKYKDMVSDVNLPHVDDFYEYVDWLKNAKERYTVFISFKNDSSLKVNTEILKKLKILGVSVAGLDDGKNNFAAVVENGVVIQEKTQSERIEISGEVDNRNMKYLIISDRRDKKTGSSIQLNGEEYSENALGVNFVVYSNETHRRLDEVGFDFSSPEPKAHRFKLK